MTLITFNELNLILLILLFKGEETRALVFKINTIFIPMPNF